MWAGKQFVCRSPAVGWSNKSIRTVIKPSSNIVTLAFVANLAEAKTPKCIEDRSFLKNNV